MIRKAQQSNVIRGTATHRRTEGDYMATLLDAVTLDDWRDVVAATVQAAKNGDAQARAWLGQYLVGKPEGKAPTPLTVVVQQLNGNDPLVERLAKPLINRAKYGNLLGDDEMEDGIKATIAAELAENLKVPDAS